MNLTEERLVQLAELLSLYDGTPSDWMVLQARSDSKTGLREGFTLGDLRALVREALA